MYICNLYMYMYVYLSGVDLGWELETPHLIWGTWSSSLTPVSAWEHCPQKKIGYYKMVKARKAGKIGGKQAEQETQHGVCCEKCQEVKQRIGRLKKSSAAWEVMQIRKASWKVDDFNNKSALKMTGKQCSSSLKSLTKVSVIFVKPQ